MTFALHEPNSANDLLAVMPGIELSGFETR
jgi:hypothetical protein